MNLSLRATRYSVLFKAIMVAGLRFLSIAFRILLLRPAAGIVLLIGVSGIIIDGRFYSLRESFDKEEPQ